MNSIYKFYLIIFICSTSLILFGIYLVNLSYSYNISEPQYICNITRIDIVNNKKLKLIGLLSILNSEYEGYTVLHFDNTYDFDFTLFHYPLHSTHNCYDLYDDKRYITFKLNHSYNSERKIRCFIASIICFITSIIIMLCGYIHTNTSHQ